MISWSENQRLAHFVDFGSVFDQTKEPVSVSCVAIHDTADQTVVFNDKPLVDAATGITKYDVFASICLRKITGGKQITPGYFQLGRQFFDNKCVLFSQQALRHGFSLIV